MPWQPYGSQLVKAIRDAGIKTPITTNASVNGVLVTQVAGKVSNFYAEGFACLPTYCNGTQTPQVRKIALQFKATYHTPLGNHYALPGYALADALVAAIKKAGSTEQWTNGKDRQIGTHAVKTIPNIGDGSPCSGKVPKAP